VCQAATLLASCYIFGVRQKEIKSNIIPADLIPFQTTKVYVGVGLLSNNTVWTCRYIPTFWRNILSPSS
jgi:hypothetical protein